MDVNLYGDDKGEVCGRLFELEPRCTGRIEIGHPQGECTCHLGAPPCWWCTSSFFHCPECDWSDEE